MKYLILAPIIIPLVGGALVFAFRFENDKKRSVYLLSLLAVNSILVWVLAFMDINETLILAKFANSLTLSFRVDGLSKVFSCLVSTMWIPATIYSFSYMKQEREHLQRPEKWVNAFFAYYTMTFGVTVGLSYAGNPLTMYVFFEALTLVTLPLVISIMDEKSINAGRRYLRYMLGGAAFGFIALVFLIYYSTKIEFTYGGILDLERLGDKQNLLLLVYVAGFLGFGVKTAIFPFGRWLISASAAPTPVTALLHAVAVVKAGAFVLIRLTYYCFGTELLSGTWAQYVVLAFVSMTMIYGSTMAAKETHLKRRLAYSTMSNLSYILLGVVIMSKAGLIGALCHIVFHAFMKIGAFFCVGVLMQRGKKTYVDEINGTGKQMPLIMACFTISSIALVGIPPFCGFISKWKLAEGVLFKNDSILYIGLFALLYAALMTAIYMLTMVVRVWFPAVVDEPIPAMPHKADRRMKIPLVFFAIMVIVFGVASQPIITFFESILK